MKTYQFPWRYFVAALFFLALPVAQAQFNYVTNYVINSGYSITITGYTGPGGTVTIPAIINGYIVKNIGEDAFENNTSVTGVVFTNLPAYLSISVATSAFMGCTGLTNVIFGDVTNIGDLAFADCTNLAAVYFVFDAPTYQGSPFYGDPGTTVYYRYGTLGWGPTYGGAPAVAENAPSDFSYQLINGSITITGYKGTSQVVAIPSFINGYPVASIVNLPPPLGAGAFHAISVTIPNTVSNIGNYAFGGCLFTNIIIPDSVTSIGQNAFLECTNLATVTIPHSVTNIAPLAFQYCYNLANYSVNATNPAYSSSNGVLFDKAQKTVVDYPEALANGSYTIPNGVTGIVWGAFEHCTSLTNVVIPNTVTSIQIIAFEFCTNLASACFLGNAPPDAGSAFWGDPKCIVYYLPGTTGWTNVYGGAPTQLWYQPQPTVLSFEPSFGVQNNQFGFTISWATNASVVVQACTNLANPGWIPLVTNVLSNGTNYFSDPQWANYPNRFYRVSEP
ncbi:MAG TPA: leucine-rich repeat domain-containing protein [Pseudomonadales bacterium]|nr:leucine-rich repeat domain-containing protein [Pseudomonadales bacterium]